MRLNPNSLEVVGLVLLIGAASYFVHIKPMLTDNTKNCKNTVHTAILAPYRHRLVMRYWRYGGKMLY